MKKNVPSESNESLNRVLRQWSVTSPLPPRFTEKVWQRIEVVEAQRNATVWGTLLNCLETPFPHPVIAAAYLTVFLAVGLSAGYWHGRHATFRLDAALGARYVQSVDPYQAARPINR